MDINNFYGLFSRGYMTNFTAYPDWGNLHSNKNLDPECMLVVGMYDAFEFPITFKYHHGKKMCDIMDIGYAALHLISENFKNILETYQLTGWKTFPIKLIDKNGEIITGYYGFSITGRCGPIDYSKSEIIEKRLVPHGPLSKYLIGLYIGLDEWDGSDFFLSKEHFGTFVTSKTMKLLKDNKVTNIYFENLATYELNSFTAESNIKNFGRDHEYFK